MSDLLILARDYLDRMANPIYGFATNEDYSLRFAGLLSREGFQGSLSEGIQQLREPADLTSYGWLWIIGWARSQHIDLSEELLVKLFEQWSSVFARCAIVDLATYDTEFEPSVKFSLEEFPNRFLAMILRGATEVREEHRREDHLPRKEPTSWAERAQDVLVVLLQVGTPITLGAASALLGHQWEGHEQLFEFLVGLASSLDEETRAEWSTRLQLNLTKG